MSKTVFSKDFEEGSTVLFFGEYVADNSIAIEAWDEEGLYADVSECVAGVDLEENEIVLNHDTLCDKPFVNDLIEYIADSTRPVSFGMVNTLALKLKPNWKDLCVSMYAENCFS